VAAAAAFDVDLAAHRPRSLDQIADDRLTLYFVMEPWHGRDRRLKQARREGRVMLLGNWGDPAVGAVRDPYGGELAVFEACFEQMAVAMNRLMAASTAAGRR
jgi:protein-tyrosine-phosphatase